MKKILLFIILLTGINNNLNADEFENMKNACYGGDIHGCLALGDR